MHNKCKLKEFFELAFKDDRVEVCCNQVIFVAAALVEIEDLNSY